MLTTRRLPMSQNVLVVVAGPVELTMAAELARYGVPVRIIDKASRSRDRRWAGWHLVGPPRRLCRARGGEQRVGQDHRLFRSSRLAVVDKICGQWPHPAEFKISAQDAWVQGLPEEDRL